MTMFLFSDWNRPDAIIPASYSEGLPNPVFYDSDMKMQHGYTLVRVLCGSEFVFLHYYHTGASLARYRAFVLSRCLNSLQVPKISFDLSRRKHREHVFKKSRYNS